MDSITPLYNLGFLNKKCLGEFRLDQGLPSQARASICSPDIYPNKCYNSSGHFENNNENNCKDEFCGPCGIFSTAMDLNAPPLSPSITRKLCSD